MVVNSQNNPGGMFQQEHFQRVHGWCLIFICFTFPPKTLNYPYVDVWGWLELLKRQQQKHITCLSGLSFVCVPLEHTHFPSGDYLCLQRISHCQMSQGNKTSWDSKDDWAMWSRIWCKNFPLVVSYGVAAKSSPTGLKGKDVSKTVRLEKKSISDF